MPSDQSAFLALAVAFAILLVLVIFYAGTPSLLALAICLVVTFVVETVGTSTGVPFGHYHFVVGAGLPRIGRERDDFHAASLGRCSKSSGLGMMLARATPAAPGNIVAYLGNKIL